MPANEHRINLLPQEEFNSSSLGKLLKWLLSFFRVAVIITELIVMIAFLSRFWLDARNSDLNEAIKQKQLKIGSFSQVEKRFNEVQKRLQVFSALAKVDVSIPRETQLIASLMPLDISLTNFVYTDHGAIQVQGSAPSETSIIQLVANLKSSPNFESISLTNIQTSTDQKNSLSFTLSLVPKNNK
ncbi:PilN domain-containing protein [Candidatus Woesebacteria bacterium]|nr:PilN domain-containing protein [Candidatus Woesebacteria bacterium]